MKERVILMDTREEGMEIGAEEEREKNIKQFAELWLSDDKPQSRQ